MDYVIPFSANVHDDVTQFGFRTDARVVTRKNHPVKIGWTQDGFQGFVQLKQGQLSLIWNKQGLCVTFANNSENKNYDLFYRVRENKPSPVHQISLLLPPYSQLADPGTLFDPIGVCVSHLKFLNLHPIYCPDNNQFLVLLKLFPLYTMAH